MKAKEGFCSNFSVWESSRIRTLVSSYPDVHHCVAALYLSKHSLVFGCPEQEVGQDGAAHVGCEKVEAIVGQSAGGESCDANRICWGHSSSRDYNKGSSSAISTQGCHCDPTFIWNSSAASFWIITGSSIHCFSPPYIAMHYWIFCAITRSSAFQLDWMGKRDRSFQLFRLYLV